MALKVDAALSITPKEQALLHKLGECFNEFVALPNEHPQARSEFCEGVHRLQDLIAARASYRMLGLAGPRKVWLPSR